MRAKNWLLSLGLLAAMAWTIAVTSSTPNWFDPSEDCAQTAGLAGDYGIEITNQWLPPRSTCHFGNGEVYEFISPTRSVVLTVLAVLIALALVTGLTMAAKRLFETGGVIRSDEAIDLRKRRASHLATAAITGCVTIGAYVLGISIFVTVISLIASFWTGKKAHRNPWGASSLEWQAPTPPTLYNFEKPPVLHELYNYDDLVEVEPDVWERQTPIADEPGRADQIAHEIGAVAGHTGGATADKQAASMVHAKAEELKAERDSGEHSAANPLVSAEQLKAEAELVKHKGGEVVKSVDDKVADETDKKEKP